MTNRTRIDIYEDAADTPGAHKQILNVSGFDLPEKADIIEIPNDLLRWELYYCFNEEPQQTLGIDIGSEDKNIGGIVSILVGENSGKLRGMLIPESVPPENRPVYLRQALAAYLENEEDIASRQRTNFELLKKILYNPHSDLYASLL